MDKGTYNFDFYVPGKKYAKELNPVGKSSEDEDEQRSLFGDHEEEWRMEESSGFRRQALRP